MESSHCVLVLGPGVALDPANLGGPPISTRLARKLAEDLPSAVREADLVEPDNLAHVAQIYSHHSPMGRAGLEFAVLHFYDTYKDATSQLHLDLAALPFALSVTTTPDRFLFNAFMQTQGKPPCFDFYNFNPDPSHAREGRRATNFRPGGDSLPLIYGLYGSLDEPGSLILTENDLLDFLVNVTRGSPALDSYVTSLFSNSNTTFLFIGFGFQAWHVRILLHVLKARFHSQSSLVLEDPAFFGAPEGRETIVFFGHGEHGNFVEFQFDEMPWQAFASELRRRYESSLSTKHNGKTPPTEPLPDKPVAFLCHDSRDKDEVEMLAMRLREHNINVWLDKQNLRGGDRWPNLIPDVLEKQCNYFVVCESKQMLAKRESYFYREINDALERQKHLAPDARFIIPVLLEPLNRPPLSLLSSIHYIDLTQTGGIDSLAQSIRDDWNNHHPNST